MSCLYIIVPNYSAVVQICVCVRVCACVCVCVCVCVGKIYMLYLTNIKLSPLYSSQYGPSIPNSIKFLEDGYDLPSVCLCSINPLLYRDKFMADLYVNHIRNIFHHFPQSFQEGNLKSVLDLFRRIPVFDTKSYQAHASFIWI